MIIQHKGNLYERLEFVKEFAEPNAVHVIVHGCNAQGKMRSGFAKELRQRYPGAYDAYMEQHNNGGLKLGAVVYYDTDDDMLIANAITQEFFGYDGAKYVSYDAIHTSFSVMNTVLTTLNRPVYLHFPKIGADLGGGNWNVIEKIIDETVTNPLIQKHLYIL